MNKEQKNLITSKVDALNHDIAFEEKTIESLGQSLARSEVRLAAMLAERAKLVEGLE